MTEMVVLVFYLVVDVLFRTTTLRAILIYSFGDRLLGSDNFTVVCPHTIRHSPQATHVQASGVAEVGRPENHVVIPSKISRFLMSIEV